LAITTSWFIPDRVILLDAEGHLSTEEIVQSADEGVALIESCDTERVHILFDVVRLKTFTRDVFALSGAVQKLMSHPRYGWFVMYGRDDPVVRFIASIVTQIFRRSFKITADRQEALDFLNEILEIEDSSGEG